ncbi:carotenoid ester lipase precursor [Trametes meyenii]|nr:carotenoid ester lipase precursor [Trametes meyenii]
MTRLLQHVLLAVVLASLGAALNDTAPTVILDDAIVIGTTNNSVTSYFGIPFAEPPLGDLRLRLPKPAHPYSGMVNASQLAAQCVQVPAPLRTDLPAEIMQDILSFAATHQSAPTTAPQSEDCTVQVPEGIEEGAKLPVVAFIYGGSFMSGSTAVSPGDVFIKRSVELNQPVMYVSINYRCACILGFLTDNHFVVAFGFLGGKEIKEAGIGNLGLHDQRLALKWIQKYITAFGGDPDKVTLWGQSAGAVSSVLHMLANGGNNEGLFRGAIMQSGSHMPTGDIEELQPFFDHVVEQVGCAGEDDTLDCLRQVPADILTQAAATLPNALDYSGLQDAWNPRADGVFLEAPPQNLVLAGSISKVPIITGNVLDEATLWATGSYNVTTEEEFRDYVNGIFLKSAPRPALTRLFELYPNDPAQGSPFGTGDANQLSPQYKRMAAFQGDVIFHATRRPLLDQISASQPAWSYSQSARFCYHFAEDAHGTDLTEVFANATDQVDYFIQFVATLDPNGASERTIQWPQYETNKREVLLFSDGETPLRISNDTARWDAITELTTLTSVYPL